MTATQIGSAVTGPLTGLKVVAFEHAWSAPYGTMMLADMGADVVKIESPGVGDHVRNWTRNDLDGLSPHFLAVNRNKRSLVLDLKNPDGLRTARDLIARADAVVENFAPGVMRRLGLDYATVSAEHTDLVYCSISGFGETGPYRDRRAYDLLIQAEGGLLSVTGTDEDSLAKVGTAVVDVLAAMVAAFSVASALRGKEVLGQGRYIDVSMLDVTASAMAFNLFSYGLSGVIPGPIGTAHPLLAPYEVYNTATSPVAIAILTEAHWGTFCRLIERDDLRDRTDFATAPMRVHNRELLNAELQPVFDKWEGADLVAVLSDAGLACANVNDVPALLNHPQLVDRNFYTQWNVRGHQVSAPGAPWRMTDSPQPADQLPADQPGEHSASVLADWLGIDGQGIEALTKKGALG
jgi:CoA:oxalate CoA-transferase